MIIGLTGGIGSGKSAAANFFQNEGITVIDADDLAREVIEPNSRPTAFVGRAGGGLQCLNLHSLSFVPSRRLRASKCKSARDQGQAKCVPQFHGKPCCSSRRRHGNLEFTPKRPDIVSEPGLRQNASIISANQVPMGSDIGAGALRNDIENAQAIHMSL